MKAITYRDLLSKLLEEHRISPNAPIFIRVVDESRNDGVHGSYYAEEFPIQGGFGGWEDGHWSILAYGKLSKTDKLFAELSNTSFRSLTFDPNASEPWRAWMNECDLVFAGFTPADALQKAIDWFERDIP